MVRTLSQGLFVVGVVSLVLYVGWVEYQASRTQERARSLAGSGERMETAQNREETQADVSVVRLSPSLLAEAVEDGNWEIASQMGNATFLLPFRPDEITGANNAVDSASPKLNSAGFVGAEACGKCHQEHYQGIVNTAHYRTSAPATRSTVRGTLDAPANQLSRDTAPFRVSVHEVDTGLVQRVEAEQWLMDVPMDIVTGSSDSGQSYLYWSNDELYQNYVSYTSLSNEWIPSPGFTDRMLDFTRPIRSGCLECHMTFIESKSKSNHFDASTAVFGVTCERCHGPGQAHVSYQESHQEGPSKFMLRPSTLSRQQQIDICSQCHSGSFRLLGEPFQFRPGDAITEHHASISTSDKVGSVHTSNQQNRLSKSACFQGSDMVCTTCHNPHHNERGDKRMFSTRCIQCHTRSHPALAGVEAHQLESNCIDCHMPTVVDKEMPLQTRRGIEFPSMIDHYIRIVE